MAADEPDGGCLPPLLAVHPLADRRAVVRLGDLRARLDGPASPEPGPLASGEARGLPGRPARPLPGLRLAGRAGRVAAPAGPHDPAPAAHDGRSAAPLARRPHAADDPGGPRADPGLLGRARPPVESVPGRLREALSPRAGAGLVRRSHLALARPGRLRGRVALARAASSPAFLFPRVVAPLLVSGGPARSDPPALVPLAAPPLPPDRRPLEHGPLGPADVLRPSALSPLRPDPP